MEKLVYLKAGELPSWYKASTNSVPPNWREVSQEDFVMSGFFTYGFSHVEYRQFRDQSGYWFSGNLYFISDRPEGVAMTNVWKDGKYQIKFFRFAECVHEFIEVGRFGMAELTVKFPQLLGKGIWGNCCHNSVCTKCGDYRFVDSSD